MYDSTQMRPGKLGQDTLTKQVPHTRENGKEGSVMAKASRSGLMEHVTMDAGGIIEHMARASLPISMEMFMREIG